MHTGECGEGILHHWVVQCCVVQQYTTVWFGSDKLRLVCSAAQSPNGESGRVSLRETTVSGACDEGCDEAYGMHTHTERSVGLQSCSGSECDKL